MSQDAGDPEIAALVVRAEDRALRYSLEMGLRPAELPPRQSETLQAILRAGVKAGMLETLDWVFAKGVTIPKGPTPSIDPAVDPDDDLDKAVMRAQLEHVLTGRASLEAEIGVLVQTFRAAMRVPNPQPLKFAFLLLDEAVRQDCNNRFLAAAVKALVREVNEITEQG